MTIEKLTKDERGWLESDPEYQQWDVRRKVLRIIDALTVENERLRSAMDREASELVAGWDAVHAENERLQRRVDIDASTIGQLTTRAQTAEARLATAEGLLKQVRDSVGVPMWLAAGAARFLASAQPAAPALGHPGADEVFTRLRAARQSAAPTRAKVPGEFSSWEVGDRVQLDGPLVDAYAAGRASVTAPSRTEAEQAVLDAVFNRAYCETYFHETVAVFEAYRAARRGLK